jgi:hypothetical protein
MSEKDIQSRKTQKIILAISIAVILWGLYDILSGNLGDLFEMHMSYSVPTSRNTSFVVFFLLAIVLAFFSAKNLLKRQ